ncbi:MAG: hypothetical protein WCQ90_13085 [Deltaproteobacteria bacterium]
MTILNNDILKVGIIDCGAIGRKRALALDDSSELIAYRDVDGLKKAAGKCGVQLV